MSVLYLPNRRSSMQHLFRFIDLRSETQFLRAHFRFYMSFAKIIII